MKITFLALVICLIHLNKTLSQKKNCQFSKFEDHLNSMIGFIGYKDHKWPESENDMIPWCRAWQKDKPLAKNFTLDCLTGMAKTLTSVIVYSIEKVDKLVCKNKLERKNFFEMGKCGNKAKKDNVKCWNGLTTLMTNLKKLPDPKDKIPTLCCTFFWWKSCTLDAFRKYSPTCTEANTENMDKIIDKAALDPLNLICSDLDESDRCTKISKKFDRTRVTTRHRTFFPALIELFDTL